MVVKKFGSDNGEVIFLLHGGGLSWWSFSKAALLLCEAGYQVVLPILDGHAGSDRPFTTIEANAAEIIAYIDEHYNGHIKLLGGLSLGGQTAVEILAQRKNICDYAAIESALTIPMKLTGAMISSSIKISYPLIKKPWFAKLQFNSLHLPDELFDEYYRDTCAIDREDMIAFLKANTLYKLKSSVRSAELPVLITVGGKESAKMRASAKKLHSYLKSSTLIIYQNWHHGEASINHPDIYIGNILDFIKKSH